MNNLEHILHTLKTLEPDQNYSDRSLSAIVRTPRNPRSWMSFTILHVAEYSTAVALVSLLFFMMLGNASLTSLFSPIQSSSLNAGSLRAEAEAIDIQIRVLDIDYEENTNLSSTTPINRPARTTKKTSPISLLTKESTSTPETPSTTPPTVEEVLNILAQ